jgi:hypothetical protein
MKATYRLTQHEDLVHLAPCLRDADKKEVLASTGTKDILTILEESFTLSEECYTIISPEGEAVGVFGVREFNSYGIPWLLASEGVEKYAKTFIKHNRLMLDKWLERFPVLFNYVDKRNTTSINWLRFLGFKMIREVTLHDPDVPFYEFVRIK